MSEQTTDDRKTGFRLNRHFVQGLIVGVLAAVIIGLGVTALVKPDLFSGSAATESEPMLGGALLQTPQVVTPDDFDATVLKSGRPELVLIVDTAENSPSLADLVDTINMVWNGGTVMYYHATDDASQEYIENLSAYTEEGPPILAMFYQGKLVAKRSLMADADTVAIWITKNNPARPTPTPTSTTLPAPTPEPVVPAVFRTFLTPMHNDLNHDPAAEYYVSEVLLTAVDYEIDGFLNANRSITVPINSDTALFSLVGNAFGGDATSFVLPDLSDQLPLAGLTYQIGWKGVFPGREADEPLQSYTVGDIKYLEMPIEHAHDLNVDLHYGDIVLARNIDGVPDISRGLTPCDGRELPITPNEALYSLLGTRFGGNGTTTFKLPDLTGVAPIEGAKYYIAINGLFPPHGDGLPTPTPTTTPKPAASPVLLRAFTSSMDDRFQLSAASKYYLGEVILSAADYEIHGFLNTNKPITLPVDSNTALFSLVGNAFGGDSANFVLPGLSGQLPLAGLTYQINTSGAVPTKADKPAKSHTVGSIKYLEIPFQDLSDLGANLYLGDIILAKDVDGVHRFSRNLVPCDGRGMSLMNTDLYSLLGVRFGSTRDAGGDTFNIPNLTGVTPIEGAEYFIVVNGALPPRP